MEQDFLDRLKSGSEQAFTELIRLYQTQVLNTILGFVPNLHDAEDLTQEVFVEVFQSIGNFRSNSKLSTWIYRIAANKALEFIRYKKRKKRQAFFQSLLSIEDSGLHQIGDFYHHPGLSLENKERGKVLFQAIERLPEAQRTAFVLHRVQHLSHQEVAEVMEKSVGSIESLIHRAKTNLRKILRTYYEKNEKK